MGNEVTVPQEWQTLENQYIFTTWPVEVVNIVKKYAGRICDDCHCALTETMWNFRHKNLCARCYTNEAEDCYIGGH